MPQRKQRFWRLMKMASSNQRNGLAKGNLKLDRSVNSNPRSALKLKSSVSPASTIRRSSSGTVIGKDKDGDNTPDCKTLQGTENNDSSKKSKDEGVTYRTNLLFIENRENQIFNPGVSSLGNTNTEVDIQDTEDSDDEQFQEMEIAEDSSVANVVTKIDCNFTNRNENPDFDQNKASGTRKDQEKKYHEEFPTPQEASMKDSSQKAEQKHENHTQSNYKKAWRRLDTQEVFPISSPPNQKKRVEQESSKHFISYSQKVQGIRHPLNPIQKESLEKDGSTLDKKAGKLIIDKTFHQSLIQSTFCLIGRLLKPIADWNGLQTELQKHWSTDIKVIPLMRGYFQIIFKTAEERDRIYINGTRIINNMYLKLFRWKVDFDPMKGDPTITSVWIRLPNWPLHLWHTSLITKAAGLIGTPLALDHHTQEQSRKQYARIPS